MTLTKLQKISLLLLRLSLGWLFLYSGVTKLLDPHWSSAFYLEGAKTFPALYQSMLSPAVLPFINSLNIWSQILLGLSLVSGSLVRASAPLGMLLMLLYYLPILDFPYPDPHSFIVDQHVIFALALLMLAAFHAGRIWGIDAWLARQAWASNFSKLL